MINRLIIILLVILPTITFAQDYNWWDEMHGIPTITPNWKYFMIISPGYLGVNALPVPPQPKGKISNEKTLEISSDFHFLEGEKAQNLFIRYYHPFADGKIAVEIYGYPIEHYQHNQNIRDERKSRNQSGEGWEVGDLYFATHIMLLNKPNLPSAIIRMACKTASGNLNGARYTDTPAYWFDLSSSYTFQINNISLSPFGMAGFYCWQTNSDRWLQNDAFLWGAGFEATYNKMRIEQSLQGYNGWKNEKDKPANYRFIVGYNLKGNEIKAEYQLGLRHVMYQTVKVGYTISF